MRRTGLRAGMATVALVAVVSLARADAPPDQYTLFSSANLTIIDNYTKLIWQRTPPPTTATFAGAASYCQGLALDGYVSWRVPSYKELLTLVDENPHVEYENGMLVPHAIDPNAFPQTAVDTPYWTSSMYPANASRNSAYAVDFQDGQAYQQLLTAQLYVRCVHD